MSNDRVAVTFKLEQSILDILDRTAAALKADQYSARKPSRTAALRYAVGLAEQFPPGEEIPKKTRKKA